jgi:hypothetical protein
VEAKPERPKEWVCLGSDKEIQQERIIPGRDLVSIMLIGKGRGDCGVNSYAFKALTASAILQTTI